MKKIVFITLSFLIILSFYLLNKESSSPNVKRSGLKTKSPSQKIVKKEYSKETNTENILKDKLNIEYDYRSSSIQEKQLKASRYLLAKALPSNSDKDYLRMLYSDVVFIKWVRDVIQKPDPMQFSYSEEIKRMDAVALVEAAVSSKETINRDKTISLIVDFLSSYEINEDLSENIRKSYAADFVEMYTILFKVDPKLADKIAKTESNSQRLKLIQFAKNFYELGEKI